MLRGVSSEKCAKHMWARASGRVQCMCLCCDRYTLGTGPKWARSILSIVVVPAHKVNRKRKYTTACRAKRDGRRWLRLNRSNQNKQIQRIHSVARIRSLSGHSTLISCNWMHAVTTCVSLLFVLVLGWTAQIRTNRTGQTVSDVVVHAKPALTLASTFFPSSGLICLNCCKPYSGHPDLFV